MTYIDPRNKLLHHTRHIEQLRNYGRTAAPINVEIDLSNRCSLGCQWCHFAYTHTRGPLAGKRDKPADATPGGDLMPKELAISIVNQLAAAGVKSITWTGGGEPTLHPNFDAIIDNVMPQGLYTHGGHINADRAALLERRMTWVYVSLDECGREAYQRSKGVDRFDAATDGIRRLVAAEGDATIGVGFLLHRDNWQQAWQMVDLGRELGVDYVQFRPTIQYDQDDPGTVAEETDYLDAMIQSLREFEGDPFVIADLSRFAMYREWDGHGYDTCHWTALQAVITPNGKMWRCVNKREYAGEEIGDLTKQTFAEIWAKQGKVCAVNGACRAMCRGHLSNQVLDSLMKTPSHVEFV